MSWAQILFWYHSVRKQTDCRLQSAVAEPLRLPLHSQDTLTLPLQEHLHTTARRATVLRVTTPGHLEQNHRKGTIQCCWAPHPSWYFQSCSNTGKTRNVEVHVRHRAGMVLCDACYHSQKCLDAPLEPLRIDKEDISQESASWEVIPNISLSCNCRVKRCHPNSNVHNIPCHQLSHKFLHPVAKNGDT